MACMPMLVMGCRNAGQCVLKKLVDNSLMLRMCLHASQACQLRRRVRYLCDRCVQALLACDCACASCAWRACDSMRLFPTLADAVPRTHLNLSALRHSRRGLDMDIG